MSEKVPVTVAYGDGIGPEILRATLEVLDAAGASIAVEPVEIGEKVYLSGNTSGIGAEAWKSLRRTKVFLKAPVTMPQGAGYQSLNVTARKTLGLYANVRPCVSYHPFVETRHPEMDVVVIRENEEDLYTGIEYRLSSDEVECLKLISRSGSERIVRYAFEYARRHQRRKVSCFTKDNVFKMTDGLFHRIFEEVAVEYPEIENEHWIVDIGAAQLADSPEAFDVVVMPNLYGDILSDVAAQIAGSIGLAAAANIGDHCAMFEANHGSAPRRANQNLANPSGLILAAVLMLVHIRQPETAERIHNAWLRTIEDGVHTYDIYNAGVSSVKAGTAEFARAVIARLGQRPTTLKPVQYRPVTDGARDGSAALQRASATKQLVGVDVYVEWPSRDAARLAEILDKLDGHGMRLARISSRGVRVWPEAAPEAFCTDNFRCRFGAERNTELTPVDVVGLLGEFARAGLEVVKTENLRTFDGAAGYSPA